MLCECLVATGASGAGVLAKAQEFRFFYVEGEVAFPTAYVVDHLADAADERVGLAGERSTRTVPRPIRGGGGESGPHGVQFDVAHGGQEVVLVDDERAEATFPEIAAPTFALVDCHTGTS